MYNRFELQAPPDYLGQFLAPLAQQQNMQAQQQQMQIQKQEAAQNAQAFQLQLAEAQRQQQQAQQYQTDAQSVLSNPTPEGFRALMLKYPQMHEGVQSAFQNYSEGEQQRVTGIASSVYSALSKGDPDSAASALTDYSAALKNAGMDTSVADNALKLIQSGDPAKVKQAQGMAGMILMNAYGPDKGAEVLKALAPDTKDGFTLNQGEYRYDANGNLIAVGGAAKDDGSTPAPAGGNAGVQGAINHLISNEGGYNPKDANGSPTNWGINFAANKGILAKMGITAANFKDMTKDQAAQIYAAKYWPASGAANLPPNLQAPYMDVYIRNGSIAKAALAKSGGDPQKFVEISNQMFAPFLAKHPQYAESYQNRFNSNMAIASGQSQAPLLPSDAQNPAPPGFHWIAGPNGGQFRVLSDAEVKQRGLDPGQQYQLDSKTGKITGLGTKTGGGDVLSQYNIAPGETGPSVLSKIPPALASQVKALAEGRLPMPSSFALAKPYWQTLLQLTSQYDPTFDAASAPARKAAITAFTGNGKAAQVIGSVNRVANHLGLLWNESRKLSGPDLGWSPLNTAAATTGQSFQPSDARAYDTEVGFVAGELGKIAKAGVVTEGEVNRIIANLDRRQSASTRAAAIKAAVGIISGAVDPLKDQYNSAFTNSSARPNIPWVSPRAQSIYARIGGPDGPVDLSLTGANADTNSTGGNTTTTGVKWRIVQ
jgi:hypothetical protein